MMMLLLWKWNLYLKNYQHTESEISISIPPGTILQSITPAKESGKQNEVKVEENFIWRVQLHKTSNRPANVALDNVEEYTLTDDLWDVMMEQRSIYG